MVVLYLHLTVLLENLVLKGHFLRQRFCHQIIVDEIAVTGRRHSLSSARLIREQLQGTSPMYSETFFSMTRINERNIVVF